MVGYILFCIFSIVFLILYEKITVKYVYLGSLKIILTFSIIELTLWNFKKKSKKRQSIKKRLRRFEFFRAMHGYLISRSEINIDKIYLNRKDRSISKNAIISFGAYPALISFLLAYLHGSSESFTESERALILDSDESTEKSTYFSITQSVRVFHIFLGLLSTVTSTLKKRIRGFTDG